MVRVYPKVFVIPSILITSVLLFFTSTSLNDHAAVWISQDEEKDTVHQEISVSNSKLNTKYPQSIQRWEDEIIVSANSYGLDPDLLGAVMLQESGGQPSVISKSGAVGLMQIMPRDGIAANFKCGDHPCFINRPLKNELLDPDYNIAYGARFLSGLINKFGSTREALKAYGPMDIGYYYADTVLSIYSSHQ